VSCFILVLMKILVVAATAAEIAGLISDLDQYKFEGKAATAHPSEKRNLIPEVLVTGVSMVATAYALGRHLATNKYDLAINLGIAGSFDRSIALGEVVEVAEDTFSELGAEDDTRFLTLDALGFGQTSYKATARLAQYMADATLKQVKGVTVNTVHGNDNSIAAMLQRNPTQTESMEGAAFFYACAQAGIPAMQIRAVSNYVEKRNRDAWQIGLAVKQLNAFAIELLNTIINQKNV